MNKEVSVLICYHHDLTHVQKTWGVDGVLPKSIHTIVATDGTNRAQIKTDLTRNKTGFSGKPIIASAMLKGIKDKPLVPELSISHGEHQKVVAKMDFGDVSFTQVFTRHAKDRHCESVFFGAVLLQDLGHRLHQTWMYKETPLNHNATIPVLSPLHIRAMLRQPVFKIIGPHRETHYEVVRETTNPHVEKMKDSGLIVKRTTIFFNKERKERIEMYVISATGSFRVFEGENTNFEKETKTGYVLLTDPVKPTKTLA